MCFPFQLILRLFYLGSEIYLVRRLFYLWIFSWFILTVSLSRAEYKLPVQSSSNLDRYSLRKFE